MPRLSQAQQRAVDGIRDTAAGGYMPGPAAKRLMAALHSAIPCDGFRFLGIDPRTLLVNRVLASSDNDLDPRNEWLREVYLQSGRLSYIEIPELMRAGITAAAIQDQQERSLELTADLVGRVSPGEHYELYHELRSPVGGTLFGCFPVRRRWVAAVQMYRREGLPPFRVGDVAFMKLVAPAIGDVIAASLGREHAVMQRDQTPHASGIVLLDKQGSVEFASPASDRWLRLLNEAGGHSHAPLASAIWAARASLLAGAGERGSSVIVVPTSSGPARIEASPAGPGGSVAVVISAAISPEPIEFPVYWPLTSREREVALLALHGFDSSRIAKQVFLSPSTVDWHLWNIYEKLEVDGRSGRRARFFRELVLPAIESANSQPEEAVSLELS